ncbi:acyl-CoA carboxylase subunit epsilon [Streptomyces yokosukanensis]|uniref:acyl-CoA carboxylase subunit epsilon n=1 Tax=Streptomyces yokosukanensis TaxID=67386 RepID=UPI000AEDDFFE|nr:acyl-CoA carboxylase subunit epsilon [Streptomyces yokosukanensis]
MSSRASTDVVVRVERGGADEEELAAVCALLSILASRAERQEPSPAPPAVRGWWHQGRPSYRAPLSWR